MLKEVLALMGSREFEFEAGGMKIKAPAQQLDLKKAHSAFLRSSSLLFAVMLTFLLLFGNGCLVALVAAVFKDTYVKGDTTMSNANGEVVLTGVATHDLPLYVAPVLPLKELFSVETIHVTLPGSTTGPAELISGEAINETVGSGETINDRGRPERRHFIPHLARG